MEFVLHARPRLFPESPLLLGMSPSRTLDERALPPHTSVVYLGIDPSGTLRLAFRGIPSARRVLVVGGSSRSDRIWIDLVREELRDFDAKIPVGYDVDSSIDDLVRKISALPSDTVVLYVSMTRDAGGAAARSVDVLTTLRAAAKVPIFGVLIHVGAGASAASRFRAARRGSREQAARMLSENGPRSDTGSASVDWRELQRFQIPSRACHRAPPSGSGRPASGSATRGRSFRAVSSWSRKRH